MNESLLYEQSRLMDGLTGEYHSFFQKVLNQAINYTWQCACGSICFASRLYGYTLTRNICCHKWSYHIWPVGRMKFTSLQANLGEIRAFQSVHFFFLVLSLEGVDMTEILVTGTLSLISINQCMIIPVSSAVWFK